MPLPENLVEALADLARLQAERVAGQVGRFAVVPALRGRDEEVAAP